MINHDIQLPLATAGKRTVVEEKGWDLKQKNKAQSVKGKKLVGIYKKILELVFPPRCVICEEVLPPGRMICPTCYENLPFIGAQYCMKCGKPLRLQTQELCEDCLKRKHYFTKGIAIWTYGASLKKSLYRFKYDNKRYYASYYAQECLNQHQTLLERMDAQAIAPVPLHRSKMRARGYNQAQLLAKELGVRLGKPVLPNLIRRTRKTTPQKNLNDKERNKNVKNAFKIEQNSVKLKRILLVDDIYTTGSTVDEISRILLQAGVQEIYVLTLCVGRGY